jgi:hypothetical protein
MIIETLCIVEVDNDVDYVIDLGSGDSNRYSAELEQNLDVLEHFVSQIRAD